MSRILKVSESDYRIKVRDGGTITLDTGPSVGSGLGTVYITGDLVVQGETTTINTTNLDVEDNIIVLNKGEQSAGILTPTGEQTSGIKIERGSLPDAQLLFDETEAHYDVLTSQDKDGTFVFSLADSSISGIKVATIVNSESADLAFDFRNHSSYVLHVSNHPDYASNVLADDDIPNKKYVNDYVAASGGVASVDRLYFPLTAPLGLEDSKIQAYTANIEFVVGQVRRANITATGVYIDDVNTFGNTIKSTGATNLVLKSQSTNEVEINSVLNLVDQTAVVSYTAGKTKVYSKSVAGPGNTGLFFVNSDDYSDELISKNRAVLFSILL